MIADLPSRLPARFWASVVEIPEPDGCHYWTGAIGGDGYGRFRDTEGRVCSAHVVVWVAVHGPVPAGLRLLHSCDETNCVRLEHLSHDTQAVNQRDMVRRGRAGGPHHRGRADTRGAAGRARAIRDALAEGYDAERLAAAKAAGDPHRNQLALFDSEGPRPR